MSAFDSIKAFIEKHPYGTAVGVFAIGAIIIFRRGSGSSASSNPYAQSLDAQASEVQAATQYQSLQLQAQAHAADTQASANVASQNIAGQVTIAGLQAQVADNNNTLTAQTTQAIAALQAATSQQIASLQAGIANNQTNAGVEEAKINAAAYTTINAQNVQAETTIAAAPYISADYIAQLQHDEYLASLPGNADIATLNAQILAIESALQSGNTLGTTYAAGATRTITSSLNFPSYSLPGIAATVPTTGTAANTNTGSNGTITTPNGNWNIAGTIAHT